MIKDLLTLGDTVELMNSKDYRDRFVAVVHTDGASPREADRI